MSGANAFVNGWIFSNQTLVRRLSPEDHLHLCEGSDPRFRTAQKNAQQNRGCLVRVFGVLQTLCRLSHHRFCRSGSRKVNADISPHVPDEGLDCRLVTFVQTDCDTLLLSRHLPFSSSVSPRRTNLTRSEPTSSLSPKLKKDGNDRSRQPPLFRFSTERVSGSGSKGQPVFSTRPRPNAKPYRLTP